MPFFLFFLLASVIYANTIHFNNKFKELNHICIANRGSTTLDIKMKINTYKKICLTLFDASGVIENKCKYKEVEIKPDNLRENTVYYILDLYSSNKNYKYKLDITGDDIQAGECPSDGLARVANTTGDSISSAMAIAGVLTGAILMFFIFYAVKGVEEDA